MDTKYFYLNNMVDIEEYIVIYISMIPQKFVDKYNIKEKSNNGYIFARVTKVMYVLQQDRWISHDSLVKNLEPYGYLPSIKPPGLWTHNSPPINLPW